ncbi:MAG: UDP-N-acetylglucosamine 2-epimerase [Actinoplanes sp.]
MSLPEVHLVAGSCAEAVRLAPVALALRKQRRLTPVLVAAGADPDTVGRTLMAFGVTPGITLPTGDAETEAIRRFDELWAVRTPGVVLVRDSLPAALAAYWRRVPIVQLDAGRRSAELDPAGSAEADRRLLAQVTTVHLAATPLAAMNLLDEQVVAGDVLLTGSTAADAMRLLTDLPARPRNRTRRTVLAHVEDDLAGLLGLALRPLTDRFPDVELVAPEHFLSYPERVRLIAEAYVVVTDNADFAEEALAAGVPVLLTRDGAEHTESLLAGSARLTGPEPGAIADDVARLLISRMHRDAMAAGGNPFGDGLAAVRVAQATAALLGHGQFPDPMPARPHAGALRQK